jgi:hypothetical protein
MKRFLFIGMLLFAALIGLGNNLVNPNRIPWLGGAEILPKPDGWPSLTAGEGIAAGIKVARQNFVEQKALVIVAVGLLILLIAIGAVRKSVSRGVSTWMRIGLGLMFLTAAYPKLQDPTGFAMLVTQYQLLPHFIVNGFSLWLPGMEITTGLVLLLTPFEKEGSSAVLLLLLMFIVALSLALKRDLGIACGCFDIEGAADAGETWFSIVRDTVLLVPVIWMLFCARRRFLWSF